jgi:hypothetical protein
MRMLTLSLVLGWLVAGTAIASDACKQPAACTEVQTFGAADQCGRCGRAGACEKHCKVVCEMKEVKKYVWVVKCEDFCAPMPSCKRGCKSCGACEACNAGNTCTVEPSCDPCAAEKNKSIIPPRCGKVRTKKTLEKKEIVCKVPSYKCVVVYSCQDCGAGQNCDGEMTPTVPKTPTKPSPAPSKTTIQEAPMPPVLGAAFVK